MIPIMALVMMPIFAHADRLKDMTSIAGVRSNQLIGYGVVVGLAGSGDGSSTLTQQSLEALISQFRINIDAANLSAKNAAAVMITSELPPFTKPGQTIDITVSTLGGAKSLRGGTLLMTPLLGADGETYAIAQGNLVVGGLGVTGNDGSSVIVNIPTVGRIPGGAVVERMVETPFLNAENIILNLHKGDFSTATNVAEAVNEIFGNDVAVPLDSSSIKVRAPVDPSQRVAFLSLLENIEVEPAQPAAKVIINSRTGTIVIGGNVRVTPAVVTHGSLTVRVEEDTDVTTTGTTTATDGVVTTAPGAAVTTQDTEITIEEEPAKAFIFDPGTELSDIVDAINAVGAGPADMVTILEALREAGALRAQLIII
ncbi:MAG: flagellar biosynthesis protein FlgI [SAR116 cluster bacterium]|nr:flagellar biosynthesis protein FlgI [SAR116 cluster bacterium]HCP18671.1 flagellar biosynthesis protein FlgI [Alphaproteobacteria bacterium]